MRIPVVLSSIILLLGASGLSGCVTPNFSQIENGFLGGIKLDLDKSNITVASSKIASGESVMITVTTRDQNGSVFKSPDPILVNVSLSGGTGKGTLDPVVDHHDGTYTVNFKALSSGTPLTASALVSGKPITSLRPTLTITASSQVSSLQFLTAPSNSGNTDNDLSIQPSIRAKDLNGNWVSSFGGNISLTAYSDSACTVAVVGGLQASANPAPAISGTASFTGLRILKTNVVSIGASDGVHAVCSSAINIAAGAPASIAVSSGNSPTQTIHFGSALGNAFVVLLRDANSNVVPGIPIHWVVTAGGGSLGSGSSVNTDWFGLSRNLLTTGTPGTQTVTATVTGFPSLTLTFTASATTSAFTQSYPFNPITPAPSSTYAYDNTKLDFTGGVCRLTPTDQTDDANDTAGFGGGTFTGASWDGTNGYVRLAQSGAPTNNAELDSSWTPQWGSLVNYWKFNNSWNDSVGSNNGTADGAATFDTNAKIGTYSGSFDGVNSGVTLASSVILSPNTNFTISLWYRGTSPGTGSLGQNLMSLDNNGGIIAGLHLLGSKAAFVTYNGSWDTSKVSLTSINDGQWHYVVLVNKANATASIYIDGEQEVASAPTNIQAGYNLVVKHFMRLSDVGGGYTSGLLDDVAIWTTNLSTVDIRTIYSRQSAKYSGTLTSRVMDALSTGMSWTTLSWIPTLPFMKELPDYSGGAIQNESSTDYSSLVGSTGTVGDNNLMSGILGLWHLDEATPGSLPGGKDFLDASGNGNDGSIVNSLTLNVAGKLGKAIEPPSSGNGARLPANLGSTTIASISLWVNYKPDPASAAEILFEFTPDSNSSHGFVTYLKYPGGIGDVPNNAFLNVLNGTNGLFFTYNPNPISAGWHHLTYIFNRSNPSANSITLYVDGLLYPQTNSTTFKANSGDTFGNSSLYLFSRSGTDTSYYTLSSIEEVAIWSRALNPQEILQLYRRGANRVKHQVRVCTASDCSDDASGANWKGPDGTNQTYFSELNNRSVQAAVSSGTVKKTLPSMLFSNFTSPIGTSRYFQYRTVLESDDSGTGCNYGSGATWCSPELKSVTVDPVHYDTSSPSVIGKTGVSYYSLASFTETLGSSCASGIGYNLGVGATYSGASWYYWNGSAWTAANGTATQSNAASVIATNAASFNSVAGTGTIYFKAYLKSSGSSKCELDQLDFGGQQ